VNLLTGTGANSDASLHLSVDMVDDNVTESSMFNTIRSQKLQQLDSQTDSQTDSMEFKEILPAEAVDQYNSVEDSIDNFSTVALTSLDSSDNTDTSSLMKALLAELQASNSPVSEASANSSSTVKSKLLEFQNAQTVQQQKMSERRVKSVKFETELENQASKRSVQRSIISKKPSLKWNDLILMAPRALLCVCPADMDVERVTSSLRPPSAFVFHCLSQNRLLPEASGDIGNDITTKVPSLVSNLVSKDVHDRLELRKETIEDYLVRVYESCSEKFMTNPVNDLEAKARQVYRIYLLFELYHIYLLFDLFIFCIHRCDRMYYASARTGWMPILVTSSKIEWVTWVKTNMIHKRAILLY